jgi:3-oxoacyl-(acyl-carrier-protein) synthase
VDAILKKTGSDEMYRNVVITGIGLMTPLGETPTEILHRIESGKSAEIQPAFDTSNLLCKLHSPIVEFRAERYIEDTKSLRLMNRDAQLAVAAARLAIADAKLEFGKDYPAESISLYGSTGLKSSRKDGPCAIRTHYAQAGSSRVVIQNPGQYADMFRFHFCKYSRPKRRIYTMGRPGGTSPCDGD